MARLEANRQSSDVDLGESLRQQDFPKYVVRIAHARFVMRRVLRILDDAAKESGLEALEHQCLIQIGGTSSGRIAIHALAERLDIVPAFASRLVKQLEARGLIERTSYAADKRVTLVSITPAGLDLLRAIDAEVHFQMTNFQRGMNPQDRAAALAIFAFYVGERSDSPVSKALQEALEI